MLCASGFSRHIFGFYDNYSLVCELLCYVVWYSESVCLESMQEVSSSAPESLGTTVLAILVVAGPAWPVGATDRRAARRSYAATGSGSPILFAVPAHTRRHVVVHISRNFGFMHVYMSGFTAPLVMAPTAVHRVSKGG